MEPEITLYTVNGKQYRRSATDDFATYGSDLLEKPSAALDDVFDASCEPAAESSLPPLNKHAPEFIVARTEDAKGGLSTPIAVKEGDSFVARLPLAQKCFGLIIGKKGATKQSIERETGTRITVPDKKASTDDDGVIVVKGSSASAVTEAVRRLQSIAASSAPT